MNVISFPRKFRRSGFLALSISYLLSYRLDLVEFFVVAIECYKGVFLLHGSASTECELKSFASWIDLRSLCLLTIFCTLIRISKSRIALLI